MTIREATCACGELKVEFDGDPAFVSACCCTQCQRRTGSFFGVTAFFAAEQMAPVIGGERLFRRAGASGAHLTFHFCPNCGSSVYWEPERWPGYVGVAGGAFNDIDFPSPQVITWTETQHPFVRLPEDVPHHPQNPPEA
jgi:hypothetical protein